MSDHQIIILDQPTRFVIVYSFNDISPGKASGFSLDLGRDDLDPEKFSVNAASTHANKTYCISRLKQCPKFKLILDQ